MSEGDDRFQGCSACATIFLRMRAAPIKRLQQGRERSFLKRTTDIFFFFCDFTARRPCVPLIVEKNIIFFLRPGGCAPSQCFQVLQASV